MLSSSAKTSSLHEVTVLCLAPFQDDAVRKTVTTSVFEGLQSKSRRTTLDFKNERTHESRHKTGIGSGKERRFMPAMAPSDHSQPVCFIRLGLIRTWIRSVFWGHFRRRVRPVQAQLMHTVWRRSRDAMGVTSYCSLD